MGHNRAVAVVAAVLSALVLAVLAAGSDRAATLTPLDLGASPSGVILPDEEEPLPDGGENGPPEEPEGTGLPAWLVWTFSAMLVLPVLMAAWFLRSMVSAPGLRRRRRRFRAKADPPVAPVDDEVVATGRLAGAVEAGLRELDQGGPGDGVLASWVLLERAAADAGTHRAAPDTPAELAGKLIDRHDVSSAPLLRLAELYREARFSAHALPESARTEARAALERLRAELAAGPVGGRR